MYSPKHFQVQDHDTLVAFMREHSFATIITGGAEEAPRPLATHMPVVYREPRENEEQGTLVSHLARANPQWRHFSREEEVLVTFTGPHAYISPAWYATHPSVPTWNYTAVHVYGIPRIVTETDELANMLDELIEFYEAPRPDRWTGEMPQEFRNQLMKAIVGFEIEITRMEGKFKLSQNRPADLPGVIAALEGSADQMDREVAQLMRDSSI